MSWNKTISDKSMQIVIDYEISHGRTPKAVHKSGVGYDIISKNQTSERFIEVKASSESWKTCSWMPLYKNEFEALKKYPEKFYLYIVKFELAPKDRTEMILSETNFDIYIVDGQTLLKEFKIAPETYCLSPISKRKLLNYKQ